MAMCTSHSVKKKKNSGLGWEGEGLHILARSEKKLNKTEPVTWFNNFMQSTPYISCTELNQQCVSERYISEH